MSPLEEELAHGKKLATELVEHLMRLGGAAGAIISVVVEDEKYVVCVEHQAVNPRTE